MTTVPREQQLVREFHETFGHPVATEPTLVDERTYRLRHSLIGEELDEYLAACESGDIVEIADALADLQYVLSGTAVVHGMNLGGLVEEVHRSNMSKLGADGKPIYREDGKVLKGPDFFLPNIALVLAEQAAL